MKAALPLITLLSSVLTTSAMAQAVEKTVALRNTAGKPARYVTMVPKGGLNISSLQITSRQVFILIDTNGGELADGDEVQIKHSDGTTTSFWQEKDGKINRDRKGSNFKVKKTDAGISLQAPSGQFVSGEYKSDHIPVTDAPEKAAVLEVIENPTVTEATPKPPAKEKKPGE